LLEAELWGEKKAKSRRRNNKRKAVEEGIFSEFRYLLLSYRSSKKNLLKVLLKGGT
jgi:hypothetical protein